MKLYNILLLASKVANSLEQANLYEVNGLHELDYTLGTNDVADFEKKTVPHELSLQSNSPDSVLSYSLENQPQASLKENSPGSYERYYPNEPSFNSVIPQQTPKGNNYPNDPYLNQPYTRPQNPTYAYPNEPTTINSGYSPTAIPSSNDQTNIVNNGQQGDGECKLMENSSGRRFEIELNDAYPSFKGQCTEWADGRYYQLTGQHVDFLNGFFDARLWPGRAQAKGWQVRSTPSVPSMIVLQPQQGSITVGGTGHVAIVESINGDMICTSNWNFPGQGVLSMKTFNLKTLPSSVKYLTHPSVSNTGSNRPRNSYY